MAVPRPVLIAILGMGLVLAALLATRNAGQGGEADVTPASPAKKPAAAAAAPAVKAPAKRADTKRDSAAVKPKKAEPAPAQKADAKPKVEEKALPAAQALESGTVVVLLVSRGGAADDTAVRQAVESLEDEHSGRVAVFTDGIQNLPVYQPLLAGVNVSQLPAVVIVRPGRRARLLEGYIDKASLRQHVTDALR